MNIPFPKRKPNRIPNFDYSSNGAYFVTLCTHEKQNTLCAIVGDGFPVPKPYGITAASFIAEIPKRFPQVHVDHYVVMPNHIHMIIAVEKTISNNKNTNKDVNEKMQYIANQCGRMSHIISRFKSFVTKHARDNDIPFKWQTRFHDRIIRDYADYIVIEHYINNNILKWKDDDF